MLRAGIDSLRTLNLRHLERLYDVVEKSTGVRVQERAPDLERLLQIMPDGEVLVVSSQ